MHLRDKDLEGNIVAFLAVRTIVTAFLLRAELLLLLGLLAGTFSRWRYRDRNIDGCVPDGLVLVLLGGVRCAIQRALTANLHVALRELGQGLTC